MAQDPKKGAFYVAVTARAGEATAVVIGAVLPGLLKTFPWPKSMRWGAGSSAPEPLRWVRPLQSILCTLSDETGEPEVVPFALDGIASGDVTRGHRFMAPAPFRVRRFDDYAPALERAKVVLDAARRQDIIRHDARDLAFAQGLEVIEDDALLAEVAGLVEWPVVLLGRFDEAFLAMPAEVIRATIRANQKCFVLRDGAGKLANRFVLVSNLVASDDGASIVAGNERVVRARLSDAKFFWETDLGVKLEDRVPKLDSIVFHEKLGTQGERVARIAALARELAPLVGADPEEAARAATLAKADLVTEMVGEFPELQGFMGRRYAERQGETAAVAAAVEEHYKPQGPSDRVPTEPVSIAVALADKLDTLVGFWAIDEKPTGSKDPYALRRAALGVVRIVLEKELRINVGRYVNASYRIYLDSYLASGAYRVGWQNDDPYSTGMYVAEYSRNQSSLEYLRVSDDLFWSDRMPAIVLIHYDFPVDAKGNKARIFEPYAFLQYTLLAFFADRSKVYLRENGARHGLIDAVFALPGQDDLLMIVRRVEALGTFLDTEDGKTLLAGYRRAANILRAEEKKEGAGAFDAAFDSSLLALPEERALAEGLATAERDAAACIGAEDFEGAMRALSRLRAPVDAFFDKVTVNAEDPGLRLNRLRLLGSLRRTTLTVADFSKVGG